MDEDQLKQFNTRKKMALIILVGTIYLSFSGRMLGQIQAITDFSYNLHELLFLPVTISYFLIPIEFVVYIYYFVKSRGFREEKKMLRKAKSYAIFLSVIIIILIVVYQGNSVNTSGIVKVRAFNDGNKYYLDIDGKMIRCTSNVYYLIIPNADYLVNYDWNEYSNKGKLNTIKPIK